MEIFVEIGMKVRGWMELRNEGHVNVIVATSVRRR